MGKLTNFCITFSNNQNGIFAPGQTISGSVIAELNAPMKLRTLTIRFHGLAFVHWSESRGSGKHRRRVHYRARETYFDTQVPLFGEGAGGSNESANMLPVGQNVFPFSYQLPAQLPCSFEGRRGHVRYFVKSTIDKPWKFNHNTKVAFTVLDTLDLNQDPNARLAVSGNDSKTLCCWCCASGPIQAQVHLDRSGYVPGEFILVSGSVENASSSDLPATKAILTQSVKFHATSKSCVLSNDVAEMIGPACAAGQSITWNYERLQIPPLPPSFLRYCNIIEITYTLQFVVVVPTGSFNLRVNVPVVLGTIPLQGLTPYTLPTFETVAPSAPALLQPSAPALLQPSTTAPSTFEPPPPSYASAIGEAVNIRDEDDNDYLMGQTTYTPQYAYYDWSKSAFSYSNK